MRRYAVGDEVRLALARKLRDWSKAGLLAPDDEQTLGTDLVTDLRHTGLMLRFGLAAFTMIAGAASVGFVVLTTDLDSEVAVAIAAAVLGGVALAAATGLVHRFRLYRHGVEEALAMGAVALFGVSAGLLGTEVFGTGSGGPAWLLAMTAVALGAGEAYRRFGFQYAAVMALCAVALLPVAFDAIDVELKRIVAGVVCAAAFVLASRIRRRADDDVRRSDAEVVRAAAVAGLYVSLNAFVLTEPFGRNVDAWFRWSSWGITWLLPFAIGRAAIVERDPLLLRVAMATALGSLLTNKSYLGWQRQSWDPMLLGVLLVGMALGLRRWLATGAGAERNGFTARQLVDSEGATVQLGGLASVAVQPGPTREASEPTDPTFSGGRSGGAGGGSTF